MVEPLMRIPVGVLVERRRAKGPWVDYVWRPVAVLAGEPSAAPWTVVSADDQQTTFFAGTADVALFRSEAANYRDNLASGAPALWVALRPTGCEPPYEILTVTADPAEGEALTETGADLVEPVAMPHPVRDAIAAFVAEHHVERTIYKRRRDRPDPEALARRGRVPEDEA
jgi:hypothetical protein